MRTDGDRWCMVWVSRGASAILYSRVRVQQGRSGANMCGRRDAPRLWREGWPTRALPPDGEYVKTNGSHTPLRPLLLFIYTHVCPSPPQLRSHQHSPRIITHHPAPLLALTYHSFLFRSTHLAATLRLHDALTLSMRLAPATTQLPHAARTGLCLVEPLLGAASRWLLGFEHGVRARFW